MNYEFFAAKEGLTSTKSSDWAGNTLTQPTADARDFWYMEPVSGAATVANQWVVLSGEQYVIMVDGDLDINANITVANGGFLAFVVNGNVSVDPAVTDVQGLYVIDGVFASGTTGAEDVALTTEGSIVAWGGVSLSRDLGSDNTLYPGEKFVYRPDLIVNMPDKMRSYAL